jgi:undecaprenyl-diphosphatase
MQRNRERRTTSVELEGLAGLAVLVGTLCLFFAIAAAMHYGGFETVDRAVLLSLRTPQDLRDPIGPPWFEGLVRDVTALGGRGVLGLVVIAVTGVLALNGHSRRALAIFVYVCAGSLIVEIAKLFFARSRPDVVPHAVDVASLSFPSGHAMQASVVYLTLAALFAKTQSNRRVKAYVFGLAAIVVLMVGASRVYLGVHWPSDVLAGWALGTAWASGCWLLDQRLDRR